MALEHFRQSYWLLSDLGRLIVLALILILSLIFLFLGFLFFRFIHHRHTVPDSTTTTLNYTRNETTTALPCSSLGLEPAKINSLPVFMRRLSSESSDDHETNNTSFMDRECSICLGIFEDEVMIKVMPECLHAFHCECVDKWLSTRSTCPVCRSSLDSFTGPAMA